MQNVVKLFPIQRKNPITGNVAWYAQKARYDTLSHRELVDAMARNTGIPRGKVAMAVDAIVKQIVNFLLNGHSVSISELGTFTPRVKSKGVASEDKVTSDLIKSLLFKFRPITPLRVDMQENAQFEVGEYEPAPGPQPSPVVPIVFSMCGIEAENEDEPTMGTVDQLEKSGTVNTDGKLVEKIMLLGDGFQHDAWATLDPSILSKRNGTPLIYETEGGHDGLGLTLNPSIHGSADAEHPVKIYFVAKNAQGKNEIFFTFNLV